MDCFFLDGFNLQRFKLLIEYLTQVHDNTLVDLLPQVSTENLNQTDLQCWDLSVHEDTSQIQLHLETDVYIGTIDSWTPPKSKSTIGDLVQTGALSVRKLLVSH